MRQYINIRSTQMGGGRNISLDFKKGICIVLMILGHTISPDSFTRHVIYSFHMPLFFVVGGFNIKSRFNVRKDINALILPYALLLLTKRYGIFDYASAFFWGNCGHHHVAKYFNDVPVVGALWFLPAYFVAKNVFILLIRIYKNNILIPVLILSAIGLLLDQYIYLPFAINQGLAALLFFYFGYKREILNISKLGFTVCILAWCIGIFLCDLNMAFCQVNIFYPIAVLGIVGIYVLFYRLAKIKELHQCAYVFFWIGKNSMALYCLHVAIMFTIYYLYSSINIPTLKIVINILLPLTILIVYKITKDIYGKVKTRYMGS